MWPKQIVRCTVCMDYKVRYNWDANYLHTELWIQCNPNQLHSRILYRCGPDNSKTLYGNLKELDWPKQFQKKKKILKDSSTQFKMHYKLLWRRQYGIGERSDTQISETEKRQQLLTREQRQSHGENTDYSTSVGTNGHPYTKKEKKERKTKKLNLHIT